MMKQMEMAYDAWSSLEIDSVVEGVIDDWANSLDNDVTKVLTGLEVVT